MGTTNYFPSVLRASATVKRPSSSSVPVLAVQRRNVCTQTAGDDRLSFSDFWSFGADDQGRRSQCCGGFGGPERRLDLERLRDIFESDDCSIFFQHPGVEEANLPNVLEHWTFREYVELVSLRAARGSSRRQAVLLWMEGQESTEALILLSAL